MSTYFHPLTSCLILADMNFETTDHRQRFMSTLKELIYVLLFLSLVCGLVFLLSGFQERKVQRLECNAEEVRKNKNLKAYYQKGNYFAGGSMQTDKFAYAGTYSMELTKEDAFGFQYEIPYLKGNENITASVWRFSNGKDSRKGILVASAEGMWKAGEEVVEKSENGWEKIQFNFSPPPKTKNKTLKIYCWNNGYEPIYFDDLLIEIKLEEPL